MDPGSSSLEPLTPVESECAVLGSLILDPTTRGEVLERLKPTSFSSVPNRTIYKVISDLYLGGTDFDAIQVVTELRSTGKLEEVGGIEYVAKLMQEVPIIADGPRYAQNVLSFSQRRRVILALDELRAEILRSPEFNGGAILNRVIGALADSRHGALVVPMADILPSVLEVHMDGAKLADDRPLIGLEKLDAHMNLFTPGEVSIIAGRPGCGKSTFMRQMVAAAAKSTHVLIFSLEVSSQVLSAQILCEAAGVPYYDWRRGTATEEQKTLVIQYAGYDWWKNIHIYDRSAVSALDVSIALTNQMAKGNQIGLVAIDYLGLMKHEKAERNDLAIAATTRAIKQVALERKVPVALLAQLNREVERRGGGSSSDRPRLSDLRDSGSIEQDADNVVFLWRRDREAEYSLVEERVLTIAKHRNGAVAELDLLFDKQRGRFSEQMYGGKDGRAAASGEGA